MREIAEMMLNGAFCEGCGKFIDADAAIQVKKCEDCFESELIDAVENNIWPDGITFSVWQNIKRKYSEPELAFRE